MNVLLSIKPQYAQAILTGRKKYEFRKYWPRKNNRHVKVYLYTTAPIMKIVGTFTTKSIIEGHPKTLWRRFGSSGGIDARSFFEYFGTRDRGFAIEIDNLEVFSSPVEPRDHIRGFVPPQSYAYVSSNLSGVSSIR